MAYPRRLPGPETLYVEYLALGSYPLVAEQYGVDRSAVGKILRPWMRERGLTPEPRDYSAMGKRRQQLAKESGEEQQ
jgi:hypothetical protein